MLAQAALSVQSASVQFASVQFGSVQLGAVQLAAVQLGAVPFALAELQPAHVGQIPFDLAHLVLAQFQLAQAGLAEAVPTRSGPANGVLAEWTWNPVDLTVLVVLAFGLIGGIVKGFTWQVVRLAFLVGAFWGAARFSVPVGKLIGSITGERVDDSIERGVAYTLLFAGIYLGSIPIALWLRSGIGKLKLRSYDRMVGGLLGVAKSTAVAYVALLLVIYMAPRVLSSESRLEATVRSSLAYVAVTHAHPAVAGIFPPEFHQRVAEFRTRVEDRLDLPEPASGPGTERFGETDPHETTPDEPTLHEAVPQDMGPAGPGTEPATATDPSIVRGRIEGVGETTREDSTQLSSPPLPPHSLERSEGGRPPHAPRTGDPDRRRQRPKRGDADGNENAGSLPPQDPDPRGLR